MYRLNKAGFARIGAAIVLPEVFDTCRCADIGAYHRQPTGAAAMKFVDLRSARAILARLGIELARWSTALRFSDLAAMWICTSPQTRKPAKEHMYARREQRRISGVALAREASSSSASTAAAPLPRLHREQHSWQARQRPGRARQVQPGRISIARQR